MATAFQNGAEIEFTVHEMIGSIGGYCRPRPQRGVFAT